MTNTDQFDLQILDLVNSERAKYGLNPLSLNEKLDIAADNYSQRMATGDFFSHNDPNGSTMVSRVQQVGYQYTHLGENIAAGQSTAVDVFNGWMNSPGHRANILNSNFTHMGLGYYNLNPDGGQIRYQHYWTQVFGAGDNSSVNNPNPHNNGFGIGVGDSIVGDLSFSDSIDLGTYYTDEFVITNVIPGQQIQINLDSSRFDAFLEVVDSAGAIVASDNDSGFGTNAQLSFTATAGVDYTIKASSAYAFETGDYTLSTSLLV